MPPPTIRLTPESQNRIESAGEMTFIAQLSHAAQVDVVVPFTISGTASNTLDYTITESPVTITAGELGIPITITLVDDNFDEPDETIIATIGSPTNASPELQNIHVATIFDNDPSPTVSFFISSSSGPESVTKVNLEVVLSAASTFIVTVDYAEAGGTASIGDIDFVIAAGTLRFEPGETSQLIGLTIMDDIAPEPTETALVSISNPSNSTLDPTKDVYTYIILDND
tara:strand:- start:292 stop:972 length:681 start_codon:yes stop_codon:yes gene_type:complete